MKRIKQGRSVTIAVMNGQYSLVGVDHFVKPETHSGPKLYVLSQKGAHVRGAHYTASGRECAVALTDEDVLSGLNKQEEKEADLFASHFLMPKEGFDQEWEETAGLPFPDRVMKVKRIFRVSYKTVLFRLIEKGLVDNSIWRRFSAIYEKRYQRKLSYKEEPFSEGAEPLGMDSIDSCKDRWSADAFLWTRFDRSASSEVVPLSSGTLLYSWKLLLNSCSLLAVEPAPPDSPMLIR